MIPLENRHSLSQTRPFPEPGAGEQTHILLVDDDEVIRTIFRLGLLKLGYAVSTADSGKKALETAAQNKDIQLLLTDVLMPTMSGVELANQLRKTHPHVEVLFVSGHHRTTIPMMDVPFDSIHFLQKPFTAIQLDNRIKTILSKRNEL